MRTTNEPCPRCIANGGDRRGDNLVCYVDGGYHCFSCGYHSSGAFRPKEQVDAIQNKAVLPADFQREIPARAWEWLLQYGLSWKYWREFVGWSEQDSRLVFTVGDSPSFSIGRAMEGGARTHKPSKKWYVYGNSHNSAHVFGKEGKCVVLVEDIISAHKVGQETECIPLFGTKVFDSAIPLLRYLGKPVLMWLDRDQDQWAMSRANQLSILTGLPVSYTSTESDPKCQKNSSIMEIVNEHTQTCA